MVVRKSLLGRRGKIICLNKGRLPQHLEFNMSALLSQNSTVLQVQKLSSECVKLKLKLKYNNQLKIEVSKA